jgi:hypothetical protein
MFLSLSLNITLGLKILCHAIFKRTLSSLTWMQILVSAGAKLGGQDVLEDAKRLCSCVFQGQEAGPKCFGL